MGAFVQRVFRRETVEGWLLLLPAMAVMAVFTHWPVVATIIDSFYSTPKARRPSRFVGLDKDGRRPRFLEVADE
jgi:ABC-type sugar transport system permease subunit